MSMTPFLLCYTYSLPVPSEVDIVKEMEFFALHCKNGEAFLKDLCTPARSEFSDDIMGRLLGSWRKCFLISGQEKVAQIKWRLEMVRYARLFNEELGWAFFSRNYH